MGSGSGSSGSGSTRATSLNPVGFTLGEILNPSLGAWIGPGGEISHRWKEHGGQSFLGNTIFGDLTSALSGLGDFSTAFDVPDDYLSGAATSGLDFFGSSFDPAVRELVDTGFKTDIQPAVDYSKYLFENEFLPSLTEQYGTQFGLRSGDADVQAAMIREAGRRSSELGALDIELSESAAGRRLSGIPLAAELNPMYGAQSLLAYDQAANAARRARSPGGQALDLLSALNTLESTPVSVGSQSQSSKQGGLLSCHVAAEYFGWFTPEWYAARNWIHFGWNDENGMSFRRFYLKNSRRLADLVRKHGWLRAGLRPLFEWAAEMGGRMNGH